MEINHLTDKILTITDFLTVRECDDLIELSENLGYELAEVEGAGIQIEVRNNDRVMYKNESLAHEFFEKLASYLPPKIGHSIPIGLNELFRFYRYQKGHRFKGHLDGNYIRNKQEVSRLTFMIYLNDDYEGGATSFREHQINPKKGNGTCLLSQALA